MSVQDMIFQDVFKTYIWPFMVLFVVKNLLTHKWTFAMIMQMYSYFYNAAMHNQKKQLFSGLHSNDKDGSNNLIILEIGAGTGTNFQFYPQNSKVLCVDSNPYFDSYILEQKYKYNGLQLDFVVGCAEDLKTIPSDSVDVVVSTLVLCSVRNVDQSLKESIRILKPVMWVSLNRNFGKLYTLEHQSIFFYTGGYISLWCSRPAVKIH